MGARYHSLAIARDGFPEAELKVTAWVEDGTIMAVRHRRYPWIQARGRIACPGRGGGLWHAQFAAAARGVCVQGVQFHPESIITENGKLIIRNWLSSLPPA